MIFGWVTPQKFNRPKMAMFIRSEEPTQTCWRRILSSGHLQAPGPCKTAVIDPEDLMGLASPPKLVQLERDRQIVDFWPCRVHYGTVATSETARSGHHTIRSKDEARWSPNDPTTTSRTRVLAHWSVSLGNIFLFQGPSFEQWKKTSGLGMFRVWWRLYWTTIWGL